MFTDDHTDHSASTDSAHLNTIPSPESGSRLNRMAVNLTLLLAFGRPLLVFLAFSSTLWLMASHYPPAYILGLCLLVAAMCCDWGYSWFSNRCIPHSKLGPVMDRMTDRLTLSIIFPVLGAGMIWRLRRLELDGSASEAELFHALFVLSLCVIVLMRDQFIQFLRSLALSQINHEAESYSLSRLRTWVFFPMAALLYTYAFYLPTQGWEKFYAWLNWINYIPLQSWYVIEIVFLVINLGSITLNIKKYGALALDGITDEDQTLRLKILAVIPNTLTLFNGLLGIAAIVFAFRSNYSAALLLIIGAALFDRLDGLAARRLGVAADTNPINGQERKPHLGAILDDISDMISFGIAPPCIYALLMLRLPAITDLWQQITIVVCVIYAMAAGWRLIHFTLDSSPVPGFFKGMPVPAAALLTVSAIETMAKLFANPAASHSTLFYAATAVILIASFTMNLFPVRYIHIGRFISRHPMLFWGITLPAITTMFFSYFGITFLVFSVGYLFSPLFTRRVSPAAAAVESAS